MWDSVGDTAGQRMIRRRHAWQHFRLEWPDGTEIGRVRANWNGGTKAVSVSGSSYAVKRVGIERRSGSLTEAASGRLVGSWHRFQTKNVADFADLERSAQQLLGPGPWIISESERTLWPGFAFEGGEHWVFRVDGQRLRTTTARLFDPQGNVVVTMRFLPRWPVLGSTSLGMPRGEAVFAVPATPDVMAVTAIAFEKFDTMFMPKGG
jgi:hypothetical protein